MGTSFGGLTWFRYSVICFYMVNVANESMKDVDVLVFMIDATRQIQDMEREIPYIRVLGFNDKGRELLSFKKNKIPVVTALSAAREISPFFARCEEKTTAVFNLSLKNQDNAKNEYTSQIIKL